jgi:hypothetical protein
MLQQLELLKCFLMMTINEQFLEFAMCDCALQLNHLTCMLRMHIKFNYHAYHAINSSFSPSILCQVIPLILPSQTLLYTYKPTRCNNSILFAFVLIFLSCAKTHSTSIILLKDICTTNIFKFHSNLRNPTRLNLW